MLKAAILEWNTGTSVMKVGLVYVNIHILRHLKEELAWSIEKWLWVISNTMLFKTVTIDGERFTGVNICGFSTIKVFMEIMSCCLGHKWSLFSTIIKVSEQWKNDLGLYCSLVFSNKYWHVWFGDILLGLAPITAFTKLRFYIIKRHKGNKNTCICVEMYGEVSTSSTIGQQVTRLEFPSIPGSNIRV